MASKPIRRSVTGLTNKNASNSNLSSTGQPTSVSNGHPKQCVCKTCTCGRHRCTGRDHSNVTSVGGHATFEGTTENRSEFRAHTLPPRPPVPQFHPTYHFIVFMQPKERPKPPASLPLEGMTESKAQYKQHELPPKHPVRDIIQFYGDECRNMLRSTHRIQTRWMVPVSTTTVSRCGRGKVFPRSLQRPYGRLTLKSLMVQPPTSLISRASKLLL